MEVEKPLKWEYVELNVSEFFDNLLLTLRFLPLRMMVVCGQGYTEPTLSIFH